jgi:hypothetical protein
VWVLRWTQGYDVTADGRMVEESCVKYVEDLLVEVRARISRVRTLSASDPTSSSTPSKRPTGAGMLSESIDEDSRYTCFRLMVEY